MGVETNWLPNNFAPYPITGVGMQPHPKPTVSRCLHGRSSTNHQQPQKPAAALCQTNWQMIQTTHLTKPHHVSEGNWLWPIWPLDHTDPIAESAQQFQRSDHLFGRHQGCVSNRFSRLWHHDTALTIDGTLPIGIVAIRLYSMPPLWPIAQSNARLSSRLSDPPPCAIPIATNESSQD